MSRIKPDMDASAVERFLREYGKRDISGVQPIEQGELSRAYYFQSNSEDYVIRFKKERDGFERERLLYKMFPSQDMPMPRIADIGSWEDIYYCISLRAPGKTLVSMPLEQIQAVLPDLLDKFVRIARLDLQHTDGYGSLNASGQGTCGSWAEFLQLFFDESQIGFWHGWRHLFEGGMLERDVFDGWYDLMMELAAFVPKERHLVHGDFHLGNMISDGRRVTGIVDWEMAMYGDFLFDVATIDMWTPELQFPRLFLEYAVNRGIKIDHFEERLLCAYLCKGIDGLRFYAKKDDRGAYEYMKRKIGDLLSGRKR